MDKIKNGLKGLAEEAAQKGQEAVYTAAAGIEQNASFRGLGKLVKGVVAKGREIRANIEEKGGLVQIAQEGLDAGLAKAEEAIERVNARYSDFESEFFSDGKVNQDKINAALDNAAELSKKYGGKAVEKLRELAIRGAEAATTTYRDFAPDANERKTTYAGIGSGLPFYILTRADGDKCLTFHEEMRKGIEGRPSYKGKVLADIKAYVICDRKELIQFYREKNDEEMLKIVKNL